MNTKKMACLKMLLVIFTMELLLVGCGRVHDVNLQEVEPMQIGVVQFADHKALDDLYDAFYTTLVKNGLVDGIDVVIDLQNAQGDVAACAAIADRFVSEKKDLIVAISTPAAQIVAEKTKDIPVLAAAVTDPVGAGLVKTAEKPSGNVTGTSDRPPVEMQIDLLKQVLPNAKTVGIVYCSAEQNSVYQAKLAKEAAAKRGLSSFDVAVSDVVDLKQKLTSAVERADVLYLPADNLIASNMPLVVQASNAKKMPLVCAEKHMVNAGGLMTYSISYETLGVKTGTQAVRVLKQKEDISAIPVEFLSDNDLQLEVNVNAALTLGIGFPQNILNQLKQIS